MKQITKDLLEKIPSHPATVNIDSLGKDNLQQLQNMQKHRLIDTADNKNWYRLPKGDKYAEGK